MNKDLVLIDNDVALTQLCGQLQACSWLAVDTEFERVNTYYPQLCLVQITGNGTTVVIDALAITDPGPLFDLLYAPSITKVFHAARQDLEIFFHEKGEVPVPLFDTQIAAAVLGHDKQIGYANLIKEILGVELAKSQTRTNWKRRPLSRNQIEYAADDVIYLAQAYEVMLEKLTASGQLFLLEDEFNALTRAEIYLPAPENMWLKIKDREVKRMERNMLAVLQQLAAWREITARAENLPRSWVLKDNALVNMAKSLPASCNDLSRISGVNKAVVERHGQALVEIIGRAADEFSSSYT